MKQCSLDARSESQRGPPFQGRCGKKLAQLAHPCCSRNARPQKDEEGVARRPPCSQNAHDETVLVRCAQSRAALATPFKEVARIGIPRWTRAMEDQSAPNSKKE
jgi:hypothetical protein